MKLEIASFTVPRVANRKGGHAFYPLPVFPLPRPLCECITARIGKGRKEGGGGGEKAKKVVKRIIEITPGASPAFTTIYLHRRYIKESLGIFTRGTEGSPPCLRYSRFPLSVLVLLRARRCNLPGRSLAELS